VISALQRSHLKDPAICPKSLILASNLLQVRFVPTLRVLQRRPPFTMTAAPFDIITDCTMKVSQLFWVRDLHEPEHE
jgi:hypothetical protein